MADQVGSTDSVEALAALYAAERADVQNVLGHSLTLISILVAYSAIIGATWTEHPDAIPHWMTIFLPVPVLAAIAWHSQMNSLVFAHNQSIQVLEEQLFKHIPSIGNDATRKLWVGATSGRLVTDVPILIKEKRFALLAASVTAYGAVGLIVVGLTAGSVWISISNNYAAILAYIMAAFYLIIIVFLVWSYITTLKIDVKVLDKWAASARMKKLI